MHYVIGTFMLKKECYFLFFIGESCVLRHQDFYFIILKFVSKWNVLFGNTLFNKDLHERKIAEDIFLCVIFMTKKVYNVYDVTTIDLHD